MSTRGELVDDQAQLPCPFVGTAEIDACSVKLQRSQRALANRRRAAQRILEVTHGVGQMLGALDCSEVPEDRSEPIGWRRLDERAPEVRDRRFLRAATHRCSAGPLQSRDPILACGRLRLEQVNGDLLEVRSLRCQQISRGVMHARTIQRGDHFENERAHELMLESQRRFRGQHVGPHEDVVRLRSLVEVEPGNLRGSCETRIRSKHGHCRCEPPLGGARGTEPRRDPVEYGRRLEGGQFLLCRHDSAAHDLIDQRGGQERHPVGGVVAGLGERGVRVDTTHPAQICHAVETQRSDVHELAEGLVCPGGKRAVVGPCT